MVKGGRAADIQYDPKGVRIKNEARRARTFYADADQTGTKSKRKNLGCCESKAPNRIWQIDTYIGFVLLVYTESAMVMQGDIEVQLVYAETDDGSKPPFKEHPKHAQVYVEVEPDCEYFIAVRRAKHSDIATYECRFQVDDQDLGYHLHLSHVKDDFGYYGLLERKDGIQTTHALKFVKPRISQSGADTQSRLLMGKVTVSVYEAKFHGYTISSGQPRDFSAATLAEPVVGLGNGMLAKKKGLRTGQGSTQLPKVEVGGGSGKSPKWSTGRLVDTIELNYCAALGLIEVGVLAKPDVMTHHRMKHPADPGQVLQVQPKKIRTNGTEVELFELPDE